MSLARSLHLQLTPLSSSHFPAGGSDADGALLRRIADGDERALAELYDRYAGISYSLAFAMLRDAADAEEVVGDAFAQIWRTVRSFEASRGSLQAWVTTLVRSRALDRLCARRRRERLVISEASLPEGDAPDAPSSAAVPDADAESAEQQRQVLAALAALTPAQQEALRLAYFEGLSQTEIAERLQEPLGTVKSRMRSALLRLRTMLAPMRERGAV